MLENLAIRLMSTFRMFADGTSSGTNPDNVDLKWVPEILKWVSKISSILLIVVAAVGSIYAIILGINMARADSTDKRDEAKKRFINVLIAFACMIGMMLLLTFIPDILHAFGILSDADFELAKESI